MKPHCYIPTTLFPLLALSGCLGDSEAYRKDLDQQAAVEKRTAAIEVFWTKKPDRPYSEINLISVRSCENAQENREVIQSEVLRVGGDAGIVTGYHSQERPSLLTLTGSERQSYIDVVAIKWTAK